MINRMVLEKGAKGNWYVEIGKGLRRGKRKTGLKMVRDRKLYRVECW